MPIKKKFKSHSDIELDDEMDISSFDTVPYKDYGWKADYSIKYEDNFTTNFFGHNTKSHFETWSDNIVEDMCTMEEVLQVQKIKLLPSDLPNSTRDTVQRFKIEFLYEKYEEMWAKTQEKLNDYLKHLDKAFETVSSLELTPNLRKSKENALIMIFEKIKNRLNSSFIAEKEDILNRHIEGIVDKRATRILKNCMFKFKLSMKNDLLSIGFIQNIENPFPTEEEKKALAFICDLEVKQVSTWFGNHRGRCKRKILDSVPSNNEVPSWISSSKQKDPEL